VHISQEISAKIHISSLSPAPDKNPENIKIEGHLPHEMDINWEVRNGMWFLQYTVPSLNTYAPL
jgi:hypothetical protein